MKIRLEHMHMYFLYYSKSCYKQLLHEVFVISGIIKVEVSLRLGLITLTETLIMPDITKTEPNNCFIIHCFEENNDKRTIAAITVYFQTLKNVQLSDHSANDALRAQPTDYSLICRLLCSPELTVGF